MKNTIIKRYFYFKSLIYFIKIYKILILIFGAIIFIPQYNTGSKPWIYITKIASPFYIILAKIMYRSFLTFLPANALDLRVDFMLYIIKMLAYRVKKFVFTPTYEYKKIFFNPIFFNCLGKNLKKI